jgi:hypothetical protein
MNTREAILTGGREAARLHATLGSQEELNETRGPVDVFGALLKNKVAVIFRPLKGLLGAYLTKPATGVIISTQRPLQVQRFTGAHELGHIAMRHSISLDGEEILLSPDDLTAQEMQANAFASEFLMPRWLCTFGQQQCKIDPPPGVMGTNKEMSAKAAANALGTAIAGGEVGGSYKNAVNNTYQTGACRVTGRIATAIARATSEL